MKSPETPEDWKREVGHRAAELVRDGMRVGLGTGSTARHLIDRLGERVRDGLAIVAVATSERTAAQARDLGIPLASLEELRELDIAIDGADQVDPKGQLLKGLGGALLREKLVARAAAVFVVIVDESKLVERLGGACPVPVEVEQALAPRASQALRKIGARPELRGGSEDPFVTDNGNWIVDAWLDELLDPPACEAAINSMPGVLENGIFHGLTTLVLVGGPGGVREWPPLPKTPPTG